LLATGILASLHEQLSVATRRPGVAPTNATSKTPIPPMWLWVWNGWGGDGSSQARQDTTGATSAPSERCRVCMPCSARASHCGPWAPCLVFMLESYASLTYRGVSVLRTSSAPPMPSVCDEASKYPYGRIRKRKQLGPVVRSALHRRRQWVDTLQPFQRHCVAEIALVFVDL